jgi:photosystem I P700 chlorophyll a apoprotein A1
MTISPPKREAKKVQVLVDNNVVETSFEKWSKPGHFSRSLSKGPETTTWIWNLHADAHDFDSHTTDLEDISRKVFSAHFGQLAIIEIWISGMFFHGARFSNYEAWLLDPVHIKPSAQVVWPVVGQEILNGDVGGGFQGIQVTSGFFQIWRAAGIVSNFQLYVTAIAGLIFAALLFFAGWFHYHKAAPKLEWFQNVESMLNHHLSGLLGLGCLSWAGHQIHVSLPINKLLDANIDPKEIPLPHEFITNPELMAQLYPSFSKGLAPFFTLNWSEYLDFLTFRGGLNPVTGGLWLTDTAHHHLALAVLFIIAGHMYRTNWGIGHDMKRILEGHTGPFTGNGHKNLYEIFTTSWHAQLSLNLALMGSLSIIVAHHMYAMPPYPFLATDYGTQLSIFTHHMWIGGFCIVGAAAHAAIFMVRDYDAASNFNNLLDRVLRHRDSIISHLNWVCIFLGLHSFGLYIHNDTMSALGRPQDMFSDKAIQLQPIFAQWIQNTHFSAPNLTAPNANLATSLSWGGDIVSVGDKIAMMPISLGTADFMVHHIHAFTIHVTVLILVRFIYISDTLF